MAQSTPPAPRVIIYARQSVREPQGMKQQEAEVREACKARGWSVVEFIADDATSATQVRGPGTGWHRMLDMLRSGKADAVMSVAVDRMLRTIRDLPALKDTGARIVTLRDGVDTATPVGALVLGLLVLVAELEIANKQARRQPYDRAMQEAGQPTPGMPPHGYRWIPESERPKGDETRWAVIEEEAEAVRFLFTAALKAAQVDGSKINLAEIASAANAKGLTAGKGAAWRSTSVRKVLLNPAYAGLLVPLRRDDVGADGKARAKGRAADLVDPDLCTPGAWEALAKPDEFRVIRHALMAPERRTNGGAVAAKYLSTGLTFCGKCLADGHPTEESGCRSGWDRLGARIIRCRRYHLSRRAQPVEDYLEGLILWRLGLPDAAGLLEAKPDADTVALEAERVTLLARLTNLHDMAEHGALPMAEYAQRVQAVQESLDALNTRIKSGYAPTPLAAFRGSERSPEEVWEGLSIGQRRAVAQALMPAVIVQSVGAGKTPKTPAEIAPTLAVTFADGDPHDSAMRALYADVQARYFAGEFGDEFENADEAFNSMDELIPLYPYTRSMAGGLSESVQASIVKATA